MQTQTNELVVIEKATALQVFSTPKGLDPLLKAVRTKLDEFEPDVSTKKGRAEVASLASRVAKTKTHIDAVGKEEVTKLKELPKVVDAERKRARDLLDLWRDEIRAPLTIIEENDNLIINTIKSIRDECAQGGSGNISDAIKILETYDTNTIITRNTEAVALKANILQALRFAYDNTLKAEKWEAQEALRLQSEAEALRASEQLAQEKRAAAIIQAARAQVEEKAEQEKRALQEKADRELRELQERAENEKRLATVKAEQEKQAIQDEADKRVQEAQKKADRIMAEKATLECEEQLRGEAVFYTEEAAKLMYEFLTELVTLGGKYPYLNGTSVTCDTYTLFAKIKGDKTYNQR